MIISFDDGDGIANVKIFITSITNDNIFPSTFCNDMQYLFVITIVLPPNGDLNWDQGASNNTYASQIINLVQILSFKFLNNIKVLF